MKSGDGRWGMGDGEWGMGNGLGAFTPCSLLIAHYPLSTPAVFVVKAHDVVFLDVVPGLHFDNHQRFAPRIDQPVTVAGRDER